MTDQSNFEGAPQSEKLNGHFFTCTLLIPSITIMKKSRSV